MKKLASAAAVVGAMMAFGATSASAAETLVQFSTNGTGVYDVTGIQSFDWQSSGDLVIRDALPVPQFYTPSATPGCGLGVTTSFSNWAFCAKVGDTIAYNVDGHARLNDMLDSGGGSVRPATLDTNGSTLPNPGFEVTAAFSGLESATLTAPGTLTFWGLSGTYSFFYDTTADSNVTAGTGFTDGISFLSGSLTGVSGTFCNNALGGACARSGGDSLLQTSITSYNSNFIQTDPLANAPLLGSSFDTLIKFASALEAQVGVGGKIGLPEYTIVNGDLILKADANSQFFAPEPGTVLLLGVGLMGFAFGLRRKSQSPLAV